MAISSQKNSTNILILVGIVLLGFAAGYFFYTQFGETTVPTLETYNIPASDSLNKFKDLKLDFSTFNDMTFGALRIFGESPIKPGATGRTDMFAPY